MNSEFVSMLKICLEKFVCHDNVMVCGFIIYASFDIYVSFNLVKCI